MQRSNSAPEIVETVEEGDNTINKEDHTDAGDDGGKKPSKGRTKRQKQTSAQTATSGTSTEFANGQFHDDDLKLLKDDDEASEEEDDDHETGGGWGKGIVKDIKRTLGTHWCEEMTNFNQQTVAVSFFIFFAAISPAITFGAIYAKATHNWIGAIEMITATAWCGIVYSLIGGQPMMINGGTGPVLAFTEIIYKMSESLDVPFLTFNCWIGIWVAVYMFIAAFTDMNRIIVYATRFTDEIFALLIAVIFIVNALGSPFADVGLYYYFVPSHTSHDIHEDNDDYSYMATALLSLVLCIGTVQLAFALRKAKFSPFLPNQTLRNMVTDFAVVASIAVWTFVDQVIFKDVPTETLNVPDTFAPTYACCTRTCETNWPDDCPNLAEPYGRRPWFVNVTDLNGKEWAMFMAAGPALLAFILVFLDDGITWHLINHPAHKLTHGSAYNWDTLIIGTMILVNSLVGFPWLVAATVRSLNHIHALAEKTPGGKIVKVRETRLTHLGIHLLCFASIFLLHWLKVIPVPVLYGVFLFMGLVSLGTNQFWSRIQMFVMQPSKYPIEPFTQHMSPGRMRLFTAIQLALFVLLYTVKAIKSVAITFPIIIALCIPIRLYLLPKIFTAEELVMIDTDEATVRKWLQVQAATEQKVSFSDHDEDGGGGGDNNINDIENQIDSGTAGQKSTVAPGAHQGQGQVITSEEGSEDHDLVLGLPTENDLNRKERKQRRRRNKSKSCPNNMLFAEAPPEFLIATDVSNNTDNNNEIGDTDSAASTSDENNSAYSSDEEAHVVQLDDRMKMRRRRRRKKTMSCPTHMLFTEADRHMNNNYFFG